MSQQAVLIYDGDCQFCQLSLEFGIKILPDFPKYVAFQRITPAEFGLTESQVRSQIWLAEKLPCEFIPLGGHLAAGAILKMQAGLAFRTLGWLISTRPTSWIAAFGYKLVAANRHRLPGGTRQCQLNDNYPASRDDLP
jgi:predicted DCC family thiol-disulfide oxidoreductase YuxK